MLIDIFTDRYEHIGTEEKAAAWPVAPHVLRSAEAAIELIASHRSEGQLCVNSGRVMAGARTSKRPCDRQRVGLPYPA